MAKHFLLQAHETRQLLGRFQIDEIRMTPDSSGRRTGRIEQDIVVERVGRQGQYIGKKCCDLQLQSRKILPQPVHACYGIINSGYNRSGGRKLGGFSTGCRTEIENRFPRDIAKKFCGQSLCGVLHPPFTFAESR